MPRDFASLYETVDRALRAGQVNSARESLEKLGRAKVPRSFAAKFAFLSWRVGAPEIGLRLLHSVVRPPGRKPSAASEREKAEYAQCLLRVGAVDEAGQLLHGLDDKETPHVLLYRASVHVSRWDYEAALPLLQRYADFPRLPTYQRLVAHVNLAGALVALRYHRSATPLLSQLIHELSVRKHYLLLGNVLALGAQNFILQRKWEKVEQCLAKASDLLKESDTTENLIVKKWEAIAGLCRRNDGKALRSLEAVRKRAVLRRHWETVRQCDEYVALCRRDESLFIHVHFGTPFASFRRQLEKDYGSPVELPGTYLWFPGKKGSANDAFDLGRGSDVSGGEKLVSGQVPHRLLAALSADFYRPVRLASLHGALFPGECFNPLSSPTRVHQAIARLRRWLSRNGIPLVVSEEHGSYRLSTSRPYGILVGQGSPSTLVSFLDSLRRLYPDRDFSSREASARMKAPLRTVQKYLREGKESGLLQGEGHKRASRYRFR